MYGQLLILLSCLLLTNSAIGINHPDGQNREIRNVQDDYHHQMGDNLLTDKELVGEKPLHRAKRQSGTIQANATTPVPLPSTKPPGDKPVTADGPDTQPQTVDSRPTPSLDASNTTNPANTTAAPDTNITTTIEPPSNSTSNTTVAPTPTTPTTPVILGPVKIMDIENRNYTFIEHTSFDTGMNGWDFMGLWSKLDLSTVQQPFPIPAPKMKVSNGSTGATGRILARQVPPATLPPPPPAMPDENNFAFISYVSRVPGILYKSFYTLSDGAIFFTYFVKEPEVNFTISLTNSQRMVYTLFDNGLNGIANNSWVTQAVNFTQNQTNSQPFKISLFVQGPPPSNSTDKRIWLALHHVAVGGAMLPLPPTTTPAPTIDPQGALANIKKISDSIWIALYVFLFFFLLAIAALVFLIVRGRCRQKASSSSSNDYNPDTSYRLDKVYDNPAYDANAA